MFSVPHEKYEYAKNTVLFLSDCDFEWKEEDEKNMQTLINDRKLTLSAVLWL